MSEYDPLLFERAVDHLAEQLEAPIHAMAGLCVRAFPIEREKTQMSHLEQLGRSCRRFNDLLAYAMRQTGKAREESGWRTPCDDGPFGRHMLAFLKQIRSTVDAVFSESSEASGEGAQASLGGQVDPQRQNELRLRVAAICLRNLHSAYLYLATDLEG